MYLRRIFISTVTVLLGCVVLFGAVQTVMRTRHVVAQTDALVNVRDFVVPTSKRDVYYAVDGGVLYAGGPSRWVRLGLPRTVIVSTVDTDPTVPGRIYAGAANELVLYRSDDGGQSWQRFPLAENLTGSITDIAVDDFQKLVYVGTDAGSVFRLRDMGTRLVTGSHLLLNEPVLQLAVDQSGSGTAYARTAQHLYRATHYGLTWTIVDALGATPTAMAFVGQHPARIYVGTLEAGLLGSLDGVTWVPIVLPAPVAARAQAGWMTRVDALAVDPTHPDNLYVAISQVDDELTAAGVHESTIQVAVLHQPEQRWSLLNGTIDAPVTDLMPLGGEVGSAYVLTLNSRQPLAVGRTSRFPIESTNVESISASSNVDWATLLAWSIAGMAVISFGFALSIDLRQRRRRGTIDGPWLTPARSERG